MGRQLRRAAGWLAGLWAGLIAGVGFVAAPVLFATLPRADAGRAASRVFALDATIGIVAGALLLLLTMQVARRGVEHGASRFSMEMMLALGAIFCIVAGHYAIQPMMEARQRGEAGPSFAVLHSVAAAFFVLKFALAAALAWRLAAAPGAPPGAAPSD